MISSPSIATRQTSPRCILCKQCNSISDSAKLWSHGVCITCVDIGEVGARLDIKRW